MRGGPRDHAVLRAFLGPAAHLIPYHYVVEGDLQVIVDGRAPQRVGSGELILFPRNDGHVLGSNPTLPPISAAEIIVPSPRGDLASIHHGGGGTPTRMICGFLGCDSVQGNPVVATLPAAMILKVEETGPAFQYAAQEVASGRPGSATVLAKLSELLFVGAVRRYVEDLPEDQTGWLAGLRDPLVARTLALMHGNSPATGASRSWAARPGCRARRWPTVSAA